MGFFDTIGTITGGIAGGIPGAILGNKGGGLLGKGLKGLGNALSPEVPMPPPPPEIDPRLKEIRDRQYGLASEYREKAPGLAQQRYSLAEDQSRTNLSDKYRDITKSANQRGLLYSGLKTSSEAEASGEAASGLAKTRAGINDEIRSRQEALDQSAFETGAKVQQLEQARLDTMYNQAMNARREQLAQQSSPFGIVGGILKGIGG